MADDYILETRDLTKEFKGFTAVNSVNLKVRRGSIHALIGPNGAGKTTCFNLITQFSPIPGCIRRCKSLLAAGERRFWQEAAHRFAQHMLIPALAGELIGRQ